VKKVYAVAICDGEYGYDLINLVFSTKEKAEKFMDFANRFHAYDNYYIVEIPLDLPEERWTKTLVFIKDGEVVNAYQEPVNYSDFNKPNVSITHTTYSGNTERHTVKVIEKDIEVAKQKALEFIKDL